MELGTIFLLQEIKYNSNDYPFYYQKGINICIYIYILQAIQMPNAIQ